MRYQNNSGLIPLAAIACKSNSTAKHELAIHERLKQSWMLVVGPTLVHQTCLIRIHRGTMLIGCWHYNIISSLRQSAKVTWPQIQARLLHLWKIKLYGIEIVPCDPPINEECTKKTNSDKNIDHFMDVLNILRKQK
jgi:hypothetical protein